MNLWAFNCFPLPCCNQSISCNNKLLKRDPRLMHIPKYNSCLHCWSILMTILHPRKFEHLCYILVFAMWKIGHCHTHLGAKLHIVRTSLNFGKQINIQLKVHVNTGFQSEGFNSDLPIIMYTKIIMKKISSIEGHQGDLLTFCTCTFMCRLKP